MDVRRWVGGRVDWVGDLCVRTSFRAVCPVGQLGLEDAGLDGHSGVVVGGLGDALCGRVGWESGWVGGWVEDWIGDEGKGGGGGYGRGWREHSTYCLLGGWVGWVSVYVHTFELVEEEHVSAVLWENITPGVQSTHGPKPPPLCIDATHQAGHFLVGLGVVLPDPAL